MKKILTLAFLMGTLTTVLPRMAVQKMGGMNPETLFMVNQITSRSLITRGTGLPAAGTIILSL
jgi:hypothetical protein